MKTTKSRFINIVIACSVAFNLVAVGGLCYIAQTNIKTDRVIASLDAPVFIFAPKAFTKPETTALVEASSAK